MVLTKKNARFLWTDQCQAAFDTLKAAFISHPILAQWDPDRETVVEADCSGEAIGGCLSQKGKDGVLRHVAYHSQKLQQAERNYTIHDKELLAVISCLRAWSAELRSVARPFTIFTDHKALEYFTSPREMSERQARWAETLALFNYHLQYRPGSQAVRPDALSRREQDQRNKETRFGRVMSPLSIKAVGLAPEGDGGVLVQGAARARKVSGDLSAGTALFEDSQLRELWDAATQHDESYAEKVKALRDNERKFPPQANTREQIADCTLSAHGALQYRGRLWAPKWEPLTTTLIQRTYDSPMAGHPGKNTTFKLLQRDFHWEGMSADVARFVRNCHCYGSHINRQRRQGLLRPLPIADRF